MATSGSKSITPAKHLTLKFSWNRTSVSDINNTSTVSWKLQLITDTYASISSGASKKWNVTVNGSKYNGTNTLGIGKNSTKTLASGSTVIAHNSDGTKTFSFSFSQEFGINFNGANIGTQSASGTLDTILGKATITAAPNFNDEDNPTINYTNPLGNRATKVEVCISLTGSAADIPYREVSKRGLHIPSILPQQKETRFVMLRLPRLRARFTSSYKQRLMALQYATVCQDSLLL